MAMALHVNELSGHNQPVVAHEGAAGGANPLLAIGGQRDVRGSGVAAVERPFRLAVARDEATRSRHCLSPGVG